MRSIAVFVNFFFRLSWALGRGRLRRQQRAAELLGDAFASMPGLTRKLVQNLPQHRGKGTEFVGKQKLPLNFVRARVALLAPALSAQIDAFTDEVHVASLGQVNVARLTTGELVALKTQLPGVAQEVESQLRLLLLSLRGVRALQGRDFDVEAFEAFLRSSLAGELDYSQEAQWQEQLRADLQGLGVRVPRVHRQHCHRELLVQEYVPTLGMHELSLRPERERGEVARQLLATLRHMLTISGCVHADLHASNWGYDPAARQLVLYDCGSVFRLAPAQRAAVENLLAAERLSPDAALALWTTLGFDAAKLGPIADKLPELSTILSTPFRSAPPWRVRVALQELLGAETWTFRAAGPPWFLWALRTASGVLASVELLFPPAKEQIVTSKQVRILVTENGSEVVRVTTPQRALANLELLVPADALEKIRQCGLDLEELKRQAAAEQLAAGVLFDLEVPPRRYFGEVL